MDKNHSLRILYKVLFLLGIITLAEAVGVCLLSHRLTKVGDRAFFNLIGRIAYQECEGLFSPDFVFQMETEGVFDSLSMSERVQFLTWAGLKYKDSSSVMTIICELAKKHNVMRALDFHLTVLQDNAKDAEEVTALKNLRKALDVHNNRQSRR